MRESVKSVLALFVIFASGLTFFAWVIDKPNDFMLTSRWVAPLVAIAFLVPLIRMKIKQDFAPDYLKQIFKSYFNKNGFCFMVWMQEKNGIGYFMVAFQNQFEGPCEATIAIRPLQGFLGGRGEFESDVIELTCPPGGFGMAGLAIDLPDSVQGKKINFEVGATVFYPEEKGKRLRFADGILIRPDANFLNPVGMAITILRVLAMFALIFTWHRPPSITIKIPKNVEEELTNENDPVQAIFWQCGDPPLDLEMISSLSIDGLL